MSATTVDTAIVTANIELKTDEKNRQTFVLTFDASDSESMKLGRGVRITLESSTYDSHQAIAEQMATLTTPIVTLNPSAMRLVASATATSENVVVQAFHAQITTILDEAATAHAAAKAARDAAKDAKTASKKSTAKPAHDASEKKIELLTRMLLTCTVFGGFVGFRTIDSGDRLEVV